MGGRDELARRGAGLCVSDVLGDAAGEQEGLLQYDAELPVQVAQLDGAQVDPVDDDASFVRVVQAHQQVDQRRLAGSGVADDADHLARRHLQRHLVQHRVVALVAEHHLLEPYVPGDRQAPRAGGVRHRRLLVDYLEHPFGGGHRLGKATRQAGDPDQRSVQQHRILDELHQLAQLHPVAEHQVAADREHQEFPGAHHEAPQRHQVGPGALVGAHHLAQLAAAGAEPADFGALAAERLDHADSGQDVLQQRVHLVEQPLLAPEQEADVAPHAAGEQHHHRQRRQHQHRQPPLAQEQDHRHADQEQPLSDAVGEPEVDELLDVAGVLAYPVENVAGVARAQVAERELLHVGVHHAAQVARERVGEVRHGAPAQGIGKRGERVGNGKRSDQQQDRLQVGAARHQVVVDQYAGSTAAAAATAR